MTQKQMELRFSDVEMKSTDEGLIVSGYVNKTNEWSQELGSHKKFVERIMPGTFQRALNANNEIHFLAEHDNEKILASTRNHSLQLREDEHGLFMEATIAPTSWGKDYHTLIKEGIIRNMSFGMKVLGDKWEKRADGMYERSISDIHLAEVSAVRSPAYVQSTIAARSIEVIEEPEIKLSEEKEMKKLDEYRNKMDAWENENKKSDAPTIVKEEVLSFEQRLNQPDFETEKRALEAIIRGEMEADELRVLQQAENGHMIPTFIADYIVEKVYQNAKLYSRSKIYKNVIGFLEILKEGTHGSAGFVGDMVSITPNDFTMGKVKLDQKRVGTAVVLDNEIVNNSDVDIFKLAINILIKRLVNYIDERILWGAATNGTSDFQGVISLMETMGKNIIRSVSQTQLDSENVREMFLSINPEYAKDGIWLMHWETFGKLMKIKDTMGYPLIMKDKLTEAPVHKLFGQPIVFCDAMQKVEAGKYPILFGNFGEGYVISEKQGQSLKHVYKDRKAMQKREHLLVLDQYLDGKVLNEECFALLKMAD